MIHRTLKLFIYLILITGRLYAQDSVNAAGGEASGSGGSISFSVGQVVYNSIAGTNGSMVHGVQQSYKIVILTGIEFTDIDLKLSAYPNPATNFLNLQIENYSNKDWSYQLYNLQGELLENKNIVSHISKISMEKLPAAVYFLKVFEKQNVIAHEVKTFKIIKN